MFHAARPPERWSRLSIERAIAYGGTNVVETVAPTPMRVVAARAAEASVSGSRWIAPLPPVRRVVPVAPAWSSGTASASGKNIMSKRPRSRVRARSA
jgi:H+/gluconate symporter-like permease